MILLHQLRQSSATRERWRAPLDDFALVNRLRDADVRGAPLLFHAASNSEGTLGLVKTVISGSLGEGGLTEQALSFDDKGRSMLAYAVRSGNVGVYNCAQCILSTIISEESEKSINFKNLDTGGKSLLHFAAESACKEMLKTVIGEANQLELYEEMNLADQKGRVPMVYILRTASPDDEGHIKSTEDEKRENRKAMLELFLHEISDHEVLLRALIDPQSVTKNNTRGTSIPALIHAARGGRTCFDLTRSVIYNLLETRTSRARPSAEGWLYKAFPGDLSAEGDLKFLDSALRNSTGDGEDLTSETHKWRGKLLEEAAKGGCVKVLEIVIAAIVGKVRNRQKGAKLINVFRLSIFFKHFVENSVLFIQLL